MVSLFDLPHRQARELLRGATAYLTVNPVEYHGPHLSLHNDRLVSLGLIGDLHHKLEGDRPLLLAADLEIGVQPCPGPGSRGSSYRAVRRQVLAACKALAALGASRVVIMTFHGAPLHNLALEAGVRWLASRGIRAVAPFHALMNDLMAVDPADFGDALALVDEAERPALLAGLWCDLHAGFLETSLSLHYAPESVARDYRDLPPCPDPTPDRQLGAVAAIARLLGARRLAQEFTFAAMGMGWYALRPFPGYSGRPHLARPEIGAVFAAKLADRLGEAVQGVWTGTGAPLRPVMPWLAAVSLGGLLGAPPASAARSQSV